jgi:hypothetical protein
MREQLRSERGATLFMVALSMFVLIGASAIAVDIGAVWLDRSTSQKVTDAAAAVGVMEAVQTGGQAACETALTYVAVNTPDLGAVDTSVCVDFGGACTTSDAVVERTVTAGRYEITVVHPVDDTNDLMTSRIISRTAQALVEDDGEPCERVGVKMTSTRNSFFAQVLGFGSGTTTVHTVAKRIEGDERPPFNLLVLDRTGCNTISVNGGGQIVAQPVVDYDASGNPLGLVPGLVIVDSDGSGCSGANGVINVSGAGSVIRSDGAAGCGNGQPTYTFDGFAAQEGCGRLQVLAPGTPGCNLPACSISGGANEPKPPPSPLGRRYTRQAVDHHYNCYFDYSSPPSGTLWAADPLTAANQQNIEPCSAWDSTASGGRGNDYVYNLIEDVGNVPPAGLPDMFPRWTELGHSCNVASGDVVVVTQSVVVNCSSLQINGSVTINGNAVFNRNVSVNGTLTVTPPTADDAWIFFRGGRLSKAGSGRLAFNDAMVYMAKGSDVSLAGGSGALTWTAPTTGRFAHLALWSDSTATQSWSGQAALDLRGVFFMPRATASYSGSGYQIQTDAQWVAWRLEAGGGAILNISPSTGALSARDDRTILIR